MKWAYGLLLVTLLCWGEELADSQQAAVAPGVEEETRERFRLQRLSDGKLFLRSEVVLLLDDAVIIRFEEKKHARILLRDLSEQSLEALGLDLPDSNEVAKEHGGASTR